MIIPRTKRIIGDDPAVERYSFVTTEMINAPKIIPIISGLAFVRQLPDAFQAIRRYHE